MLRGLSSLDSFDFANTSKIPPRTAAPTMNKTRYEIELLVLPVAEFAFTLNSPSERYGVGVIASTTIGDGTTSGIGSTTTLASSAGAGVGKSTADSGSGAGVGAGLSRGDGLGSFTAD